MTVEKFTPGRQPIFSCLDFYDHEQSPLLLENKIKYQKRSRRTKTLIFEMINTMIKIFDPSKDEEFSMLDQSIKQLTVQHEGQTEILFVKFFPQPLIKVLKQLQEHYEVIVFTVLPRRFLDLILDEMPQFRQVSNFILSLEDTCVEDDFVVRDISIFTQNRTLDNIFVIDTSEEGVDSECLASLRPEVYDGSILYKQLSVVVDGLRIERNAVDR